MSASQELLTNIVINAQTGSGFNAVGNTLLQMGRLIDGIGSQLREFASESLEVYKTYEASMAEAEVALATAYGQNTSQLASVMAQLDDAATEWAASSIFHTDDVASAISEAAHAGWDYEQILSGIPAAMELAQAGSMDLSDAVNYIVKATNAAGYSLEEMPTFIDEWAYAANSSASTIEEFGDAMLRMGSTMQFTSGKEELLTLLAVTADAGATGETAGTLIRNSILRLVAPTEKASKAMAELGATSEETAELMDDTSLAAANASLEAAGFSAYDENGNLKSVLETYRELYVALENISGGAENIAQNQDALQILSAIFPTRTITEALTLVKSAADNYGDLYDQLQSGAADGYGEYAASTMMDTLYGATETFESKIERLQQKTGEVLSEPAEDLMSWAGGLVDSLATMDDGNFNALVAGLSTVAVSGPGLTAAGLGIKVIGKIISSGMGPIAAAVLGVEALASGYMALEQIDRANLEDAFGTASLDEGAITSYVNTITNGFEAAYEEADKFRSAAEAGIDAYETASNELSSNLLTAMLTKDTLSADEKNTITNLANEINNALVESIENNTSGSISFWEALFGDSDSGTLNSINGAITSSYETAISNAEDLKQQLSDALTGAITDGQISDEEYQNIMSYIASYNEAIAAASEEIASREDFINRQKLLHDGQTAGLDSIEESVAAIEEARDAALQDTYDRYASERYGLEYDYNQAIANGDINPNTGEKYTEADKTAALNAADEQYQQKYAEQSASYADLIAQLYDSTLQQSDFSDAYTGLKNTADKLISGEIDTAAAFEEYSQYTESDRSKINEFLARQISDYGGYEGLANSIDAYDASGNTEAANRLRSLYAMQQIGANYADTSYSSYEGFLGGIMKFITGDPGRTDYVQSTDSEGFVRNDASHDIGTLDAVINPVLDSSSIAAPTIDATANITDVNESSVPDVTVPGNVDVSTNAESVSAQIESEAGGTSVTTNVNANTAPATNSINLLGNMSETVSIKADTSSASRSIAALGGKTVTVNVKQNKLYAEGGRATEASIFGEAGAEWAIPEAHTERTASLLNAAREASGFTWEELLARNGGLNAGGSGGSTIIYSPTINANDSSGVDKVLQDDKARLEKWYQEKQIRDRAEVYS